MSSSKKTFNLNLLDVVNVILSSLLIHFAICSPTMRKHLPKHHQSQNSIIYAHIGESINISCWFDPTLMGLTSSKAAALNSELDYGDFSIAKFNSKRRKRNRHLVSSRQANLINSNGKFRVGENVNSARKIMNDDDSRYFKANIDSVDETVPNYDNWASADRSRQHDSTKVVNKYELDWSFLNKNGQMNIISYGNLTSLNFKYKIFVRKEEVSLANPVKSNSLYSSSALYSQTSSRSSLNKHVYIYYLNALIESENDEGVYLCMNPDLPNLILRNVTVLLSSNGAASGLFDGFFYDKNIFSLVLFLNYYYLFII